MMPAAARTAADTRMAFLKFIEIPPDGKREARLCAARILDIVLFIALVKGLRQEEIKVQGSGLAQGACRPLIEQKRFSGFCRFYGFKVVGAAQIIMKRRGVLIALRAVVISSVAEKSILQNAHCLM